MPMISDELRTRIGTLYWLSTAVWDEFKTVAGDDPGLGTDLARLGQALANARDEAGRAHGIVEGYSGGVGT